MAQKENTPSGQLTLQQLGFELPSWASQVVTYTTRPQALHDWYCEIQLFYILAKVWLADNINESFHCEKVEIHDLPMLPSTFGFQWRQNIKIQHYPF